MSRIKALLKTTLNVGFGISALRYGLRRDKRKALLGILIGVGVIAGLSPLLVLYSLFMNQVFEAGQLFGQPQLMLLLAFMMGQMLVFFFGIFYVMSVFYFSEDLNLLVPLPLKPYEVLGAKLAVIACYEYLTLFPLLLPPLVIYGVRVSAGIGYWLKGLVAVLAAPVLPLVLATLLVVVLMRFVNMRKRKDLFAMLGGIFIIVLSFGLNYLLSTRLQNLEGEQLLELISRQMGLVELAGKRFPPGLWAALGITQPGLEGLGYLMLFLGSSLLLLAALFWLSNRFFYQGLLRGQEATRNRKVLTEEKRAQVYGQTAGPVKAIFLREWRLLLRTPVYVLNGFGGALFGPLTILLLYFTSQQAGQNQLFLLLGDNPLYPVLIGCGAVIGMSALNGVSPTAVSREGKDFWISKVIPVSPRDQMKGKLLHGLAVTLITIGTNLITLALLFPFTFPQLLLILIIGLAGSSFIVVLDLLIDVLRPKLEWTNPQEAIKQNLNAVFGMLAAMIVLGLASLLVLLVFWLKLKAWVLYGLFLLFFLLGAWLGSKLLFHTAEKKYRRIEM